MKKKLNASDIGSVSGGAPEGVRKKFTPRGDFVKIYNLSEEDHRMLKTFYEEHAKEVANPQTGTTYGDKLLAYNEKSSKPAPMLPTDVAKSLFPDYFKQT